jgi:quercetin dioxygenase-like cupin family protein
MQSVQLDEVRHMNRVGQPRFDPKHGVDTVDDPRGLIESICHETVGSILRIFCKAGSVRSNHWHKTDWHICYVVSGEMEYYERHVLGGDIMGKYDIKRKTISAGEWVKTMPRMEHTTVFPVDTVLLVFAKNARDEDSYDSDLVRSPDLSAL